MNMHLNCESCNSQLLQQLQFTDTPPIQQQNNKKTSSITHYNVQMLYQSRDKLISFSQAIGHLNRTQIRKDVVRYCNKLKLGLQTVVNFQKIEKMVKNRIQKMIKNRKIKQNWSLDDVFILIWVLSKYADYHSYDHLDKSLLISDWEFISSVIPGTTTQSCMFKWLSLKKINLSENYWCQKQSELLKKLVNKYGQNQWGTISKQLYYENNSNNKIYRCPKQCRQHWNCYLNPKIKKGPWSTQQDMLLLKCVIRNNGLKKWAEMVKLFEGRTQNALKNRYTLLLQRSLKVGQNTQNKTELDIINEYLQASYVQQFVGDKPTLNVQSHKNKKTKNAKKQKHKQINKNNRSKSLRSSSRTLSQIQSMVQQVKIQQDQVQQSIFDDEIQINQNSFEFVRNVSLQNQFCKIQIEEPEIKELSQEEEQVIEQKIEQYEEYKLVPLSNQLFNVIRNQNLLLIPCVLNNGKLQKINIDFN